MGNEDIKNRRMKRKRRKGRECIDWGVADTEARKGNEGRRKRGQKLEKKREKDEGKEEGKE